MTARHAAARRAQRATDADQAAYAAHLVDDLAGRPVHELAVICEAIRAARPLDDRMAAFMADAMHEAAVRHPPRACRRCGATFRRNGAWSRYCTPYCAALDRARNAYMDTVADPHILHAEEVDADGEHLHLTVHGRRPTGHPSTVTIDLSTLDQAALDCFAAAVLIILQRRWPREARLINRGAA